MVKAYTQEHTYKHPWERVSAATWRKFTDTESRRALNHVSEVHTIDRTLDPSSGVLHSSRLVAFSVAAPRWLQRMIGQKTVHCVESSVVDPRNRKMEIVTRNVTLRNFVDVVERSVYEPAAENPQGWTMLRQETSIKCKPISSVVAALAEKIEQRCAERFLQNSAKGREVVERVCKYLEAEAKV